jgi:hypothetical protein
MSYKQLTESVRNQFYYFFDSTKQSVFAVLGKASPNDRK